MAGGRPPKTLQEHVQQRTFRPSRHDELLDSDPLVDDPRLRPLQQRYRDETEPIMRRHFALCFHAAVRGDWTRLAGLLDKRLLPAEMQMVIPPDVDLSIEPGTVAQMLEELDAIISAPPVPFSRERNRKATVRFANAVYARELFHEGLSLAAISRRLCDSPYFENASPATVSRYLDELGVARTRRRRARRPARLGAARS